MTQLNLTMLEGIGSLLTSGTHGNHKGGPVGGVHKDGPSFNYSVRSPGLHYGGNHSMLQLVPPSDITRLFLANATQGALFQNTSYDLAGNLTSCNFGNDSTGVVGCNYSLSLMNNSVSPTNGTTVRADPYTTLQLVVLALLAGTTCITTIVGNLIVILSFIIERSIRQPTNYFIASLAVSDLLIGTFSMPFYTVYLLTGKYWPLGEVLCDLWLSVDYTVCLTSIYTVFCITIDRFCSVKIPAKYRAWRTDNKVTGVIALTWVIPILVFFTSIFGWQYFVGRRTVPEGMCYVQYMEDALFNCVLQLGYFWVTLTVMCVLYTGIYKVALDLQRKSEAKQKKMTSLVSMAGQTMTKIGIGMSKHHPSIDSKMLFERSEQTANNKSDGAPKTLDPGHSTTSFNSKQVKDDDRSSSPAFPSDTDQSSQSPKHNNPRKSEGNSNARVRNRKRQGKVKNTANKKSKRNKDRIDQDDPDLKKLPKMSPGMANSAFTETTENNNSPAPIVGNSLGNATRPFEAKPSSPVGNNVQSPSSIKGENIPQLPFNSVAPAPPRSDSLPIESVESKDKCNPSFEGHLQEPVSPSSMENMPSYSPPPYPVAIQGMNSEVCSPIQTGSATTTEGEFTFPPPPMPTGVLDLGSVNADVEDEVMGESDKVTLVDETTNNGEGRAVMTAPPEFISGLKYIDQDSLKSPLSTDNIRILAEPAVAAVMTPQDAEEGVLVEVPDTRQESSDTLLVEVPQSPIWKRRSLVERETRSVGGATPSCRASAPPGGALLLAAAAGPVQPEIVDDNAKTSSPTSSVQKDSTTANHDRGGNNSKNSRSAANIQVESHLDDNSRTVSRLAKPDEIQPLNAEDGANPGKKKSKLKGGSPLRGLIKSVGSRRFKRKKEKQQKSKSENRARKALRVITIILGAFVLCWTPWHILSMIIGFCPDDGNCVEPILYDISYWLCYLNSPINPLCYAFANQQFKKTFIRIIRLDWHRT